MKYILFLFFTLFASGLWGQAETVCDEDDDTPCMKVGGCDPTPVDSFDIPRLHAVDPNDIIGPTGYEEPQWMSINDQFGYRIRFENDPELATAPAQIVRINSPISDKLNPNSLRLGSFGFGQFIFEVPENSSFYASRLDVADSLGVVVDITAGIDVTKNEAFWIFESIDPATNLPPTDALAGFLPVNDTTITIYNDTITQQGEGFVSFYIKPDLSSTTGDTVKAQASIVFDDNAPIETNIWTNVIDALPPTSDISDLPIHVEIDSVLLDWTAVDDPGGVGEDLYDLYVAKDAGQYYLFASDLDTTKYWFRGELDSRYAFYIRAKDYVKNKEAQKFTEDETIFFGNPLALAAIDLQVQQVGEQAVELNWQATESRTVVQYTIERSPTGKEWRSIGELTNNGKRNQQYLDDSVNATEQAIYYYRIRATLDDQSTVYSAIRSIHLTSELTAVKVFPNPASEVIQVQLTADNAQSARVELTNLVGQVVARRELAAGMYRTSFTVADLPRGVYLVTVERGQLIFNEKVVLE